MAHKLSRTVTPIAERVSRLQKLGFIKDIVAILNIHKIRASLIAFPHIILMKHTEDVLKQFQQEVILFPEVMECYHLTGHFDFMLKIVMPDMVSYNDFLRKKLGTLANVGSIQSFLVLSEAKHETAYLL